jgi:Ca-activated chloride channel family protein
MTTNEARTYSLGELAERCGVPPRTIRFYIARGLIPGPRKAGRGAVYASEHVNRIEAIRAQQAAGLTLSAIRARADAPSFELAPSQEPMAWRHYPVAPDVVVMVREDAAPWRVHTLRRTIAELQQQLKTVKETTP